MYRFDGTKDLARRVSAETGGKVELPSPDRRQVLAVQFKPYRKTQLAYAHKMREDFEVETLEGLHTGKAGDYLAVGFYGEMYPIDAEIFEATYEEAPADGG